MCWPSPEGFIEIEERRRKHKNGPRRKRLHFVKDRSSGHSDEWDLIHPRPRSRPDMHEIHEQPHYQPPHQLPYGQRLEVEDPRWAAHLQQQQQPMHHQIPIPPPPPQMGWYGPQGQIQHNQQHPNDIVRVEEFQPEHDPNHNPHQPVVLERQPRVPVARMPSHVRARSRSRHRGHSRTRSSLFSDESSYSGSHGRGRRRADAWQENDSWIEPRRESLRRVTTTTRRIR